MLAPPLTFHPNPDLPKFETDAFQANRRSAANLARIAVITHRQFGQIGGG